MKIIRMLGIAMVAALASMALMGASSASAKPVQLCKVNGNNCSVGNQHGVGTKIQASLQPSTSATLTGSLPVVCATSEASGELTELGGQQAIGKLTKLKFGTCSVFGFIPCTVTEIQLPYTAHIDQDAANVGNGILWAGPQSEGQPGARIECVGIVTCVFKADETQPGYEKEWAGLDITGGAPAKIKADDVQLKLVEGTAGECGATAKWNAHYTVTEPTAGYVVHQE